MLTGKKIDEYTVNVNGNVNGNVNVMDSGET